MTEININTLFSDVLGNSADQDKAKRDEAFNQASLVGTLGGMAAYLAPQRSADLSSSVGGLLGVDTRTESQKLKEQLQSLGTPQTDEEHKAYADLLDKIQAGSGVQYMIALGQERRKQEALDIEQQKADISQQMADTGVGELDFKTTQLESLDEERMRLDAREASNRSLEKLKIDSENARTEAIASQTSVTAVKLINEAVLASMNAQEEGLKAKQIADDLARLSPTAGALGKFEEAKDRFFGTTGAVSDLRTRINRMTVSIVMEGLPAGAASDKDIELAQSTVPTSTMNPEMLESYFRGVAKIAALNSYKENLKAKHLSKNRGSLAGFIEVWDKAQKAENFLDTIKEASGYDWVNEEKLKELNKKSVENRVAAEAADKLAKENREKAKAEKSKRSAGNRARRFNQTMSSVVTY